MQKTKNTNSCIRTQTITPLARPLLKLGCGLILLIKLAICQADNEKIQYSGLKFEFDTQGRAVLAGSNQPFTGQDTTRFGNGKKFSEDSYENGLLVRSVNWDKSGRRLSEKTYDEDGKIKHMITWYGNGNRQYEELYTEHRKYGVVVTWNKDGQRLSEKHYEDGKLQGLQSEWHDNGVLKSREIRKDGWLVGKISRWDKNGNLLTDKP